MTAVDGVNALVNMSSVVTVLLPGVSGAETTAVSSR